MEFSLDQITTSTGGTLTGAASPVDQPLRIVTDSREVEAGTIFWALHGETHDGHSFVLTAVANGAAACVVNSLWLEQTCSAPDVPMVAVPNTLQALIDLASWNRQRWPIRVIGVTGSFGKTTTREMLHAVLTQKFQALRSPKNFNNQFGVPLTLLQLKSHHEVAVIELGASACGEIRRLCRIAAPDVGVITGTGFAHAAQFGGRHAVIRAKGELAEALPGRGVLLLCGDEESANEMAARTSCRTIRVGTSGTTESGNDLIASEVIQNGDQLIVTTGESVFEVTAVGRHFARSVLFAVAIGREFGMTDEEIQMGLQTFKPVTGRCEIRSFPGGTVIDDCYNSSPEAMQAAVALLGNRETSGQRILVTGDMLLLGEHSSECHREVGVQAAAAGIDQIVAVGQFAKDVVYGATEAGFDPDRARAYTKFDDLLQHLDSILHHDDVILVKGSRATRMDRVVEWLDSRNKPTDRHTHGDECVETIDISTTTGSY